MFHRQVNEPLDLPKTVLAQGLVLVAVWLWFFGGGSRWRPDSMVRAFFVLLVLFLTWALFSLTWTPDVHEGLVRLVHWSFCAGAMALLGLSRLTPRSRLIVLGGIFSGGCLLAAVGLLSWWLRLELAPTAAAPAGTMGNRNWAAEVLVVAAPAAVSLVLLSASAAWRWICGLGFGLILAFLFHAASFAAWIALLVQLASVSALIVALRRRCELRVSWSELRALAGGALLTVALVQLTPDGWSNPLARFNAEIEEKLRGAERVVVEGKSTPSEGNTVAARVVYARHAWWIVTAHPMLGVGLGGFESAYRLSGLERGTPPPPSPGRIRNPHNDALQILAELGSVGLGIVVGVLLTGAILFRRVMARAVTDRTELIQVTASMLGVLGFIVCSQSSYPTFTPTALFLASLTVGLALGERAPSTESGGTPSGFAYRGYQRMAMVALVIAWAVWSWNVVSVSRRILELRLAWRDQHFSRGAAIAARLEQRDLARLDYLPYAAEVKFYLRDFAGAARVFDAYLSRYPGNATAQVGAARAYANLGDLVRALERINSAVSLTPTDPGPYRDRARIHLARREIAGAIADLESVVRLAPDDVASLALLGRSLIESGGRVREGVDLLERAMARVPQLQSDSGLVELLRRAREQL